MPPKWPLPPESSYFKQFCFCEGLLPRVVRYLHQITPFMSRNAKSTEPFYRTTKRPRESTRVTSDRFYQRHRVSLQINPTPICLEPRE